MTAIVTEKWYALYLSGPTRPVDAAMKLIPDDVGTDRFSLRCEYMPTGAGIDIGISEDVPDGLTIKIDGRLWTLGEIRKAFRA